ncbi:hypothetical protein [Streptomyces bikiniensis]|uniref:hypothetical protein n=1 Tax=Streptomyces bikiniensis TaxID=1896 RepID=UPI000AB42B87|nr:hypothetical protein [Streptomyces bikiniensis]
MTPTVRRASSPAPSPTPPAAHPPSAVRRWLRGLAVVACLPYAVLKCVWLAGGSLGIPAGSVLLEHRGTMAVANALTVAADLVVVVLALLLTQDWGRRVPAWLLVPPLWAATGLLVPIMTGYPAQLLTALATGGEKAAAPAAPFLEPWVFAVVYGGFILQGLALGALSLLYARDRWGRPWRGRLGALSAGPRTRAVAVSGAVLALVPAALHLMWAAGATTGLTARQAAERDADFHVLEAQRFGFAVVAAAAVLVLVLGRPARFRLRPVLATAWIAPAAVGCWGAYMSLVVLLPVVDPAERVTALTRLAYAGDMITGFLLAACAAAVLRRRSAGT